LRALVPPALIHARGGRASQTPLDFATAGDSGALAAIGAGVRRAVPGARAAELLGACHPLYRPLMSLIGRYGEASGSAITAAGVEFMTAMVVRETVWGRAPARLSPRASRLRRQIAAAYAGCAKRALVGSDGADEAALIRRFQRKCEPWFVFVRRATGRLRDAAHLGRVADGAAALHAVFSLMQVTDDWHDRPEDADRRHWNLWADEPRGRAVALTLALATDAFERIRRLDRSTLRDVMAYQLLGTIGTVAKVVRSATSRHDGQVGQRGL
jgi:hypothetical protein